MSEYGLEDDDWFSKRFSIRESWIPAHFKEIALSGLMRTTSRSESANSFFSRIIGYKHALVEFCLRFDMALEDQRHKELQEDHMSLHTMHVLKTSWAIEKHGAEVFMHEIFQDFQHELLADRDHCLVEMMAHDGEVKTVTIRDGYKKLRVVTYNTTTSTYYT